MGLLIVAYHYIEDEDKYKAGIYPTSLDRFSKQLKIISKKYEFISIDDLILAAENKKEIPENSCLLTFDDGLISHYETVFPFLKKESIPASFFVPTQHLEGKAYTTHKIHYLLSRVSIENLLDDLEVKYLEEFKCSVDWEEIGVKKITDWYRYDDEKSAKFKYLINHFLDENFSKKIIDKIFDSRFEGSEKEFCDEFFINAEQIKEMSDNPLVSIGLHTHRHISISQSDKDAVYKDVVDNYRSLGAIIGKENVQSITYPFGLVTEEVFQEKIKKSLEDTNISIGFTTEKMINDNLEHVYRLGRYGTNDLEGGKYPILNI